MNWKSKLKWTGLGMLLGYIILIFIDQIVLPRPGTIVAVRWLHQLIDK